MRKFFNLATPINWTMKQRIIWSTLTLFLVIAGTGLYGYTNRERLFIERAFVQLAGGRGSEPVATIQLESGETASVILEHGCCSGAGFDAVAVRTSDGEEYASWNNYCGLNAFEFSLKDDAWTSLAEFKSFLSANGFTKR